MFSFRLLLVLSALLSSGIAACGRGEPDIDPELEPILQEYLDHAPTVGNLSSLVSLKIGIPDESDPTHLAGKCVKTPWGYGEVRVGIDLKITVAPIDVGSAQFKATVFHELAHCLHNFDHNEEDKDAIMAPSNTSPKGFWEVHLYEKLLQMFREGRK